MPAEAVERDLSYNVCCPAILICGNEDKAGHNSNTDRQKEVNGVIGDFLNKNM